MHPSRLDEILPALQPASWYGNWYSPSEPDPPAPEPPSRKDHPRPGEPQPEPEAPDAPQPDATGLVLGRFCPPHRGHQVLIDFARASVRQLTVMLCSTVEDPIPAEPREAWMRELYPDVRLLHERMPSGQEKRSWADWAAAVRAHLPSGPDLLFASERSARHLAQRLGAELVLVDPERRAVPIAAERIRTAPLQNWRFLPDCVRPWFARRVAVAGAERTGKSTLARRLA